MPSFCRHNRLIQNCPICSKEQQVEMRPVVSSSTPGAGVRERRPADPAARRPRGGGRATTAGGVRVSRLARAADDGYRSPLVPGLRSSVDAERLAQELAFATARLELLSQSPPGLYAEVAQGQDSEERTWLAFLIAYLCPLDGEDPFASIRTVRTSWASQADPTLESVALGPRSAHDPSRRIATLEAYRAWAARAGAQAQAFRAEQSWTAERRFARVYERLALPGLHRDARYDLLVTLGRLGVYDLTPSMLAVGGENTVTLAAKRAFGIGDPMLLERRAAALADACQLPLEALDLGLFNWERGERATLGVGGETVPERGALDTVRAALKL